MIINQGLKEIIQLNWMFAHIYTQKKKNSGNKNS